MNLSKNSIKKLNDLGHRPITRRDWFSALSKGAIGFSTLSTLSHASESKLHSLKSKTQSAFPAMIVLDLAGGAGLAGNFLVGKKGGATDLLSSYSRLGWDPRKGNLEMSYGAPLAQSDVSQFLAGFNSTTSAQTRLNTKFSTICHFGQDDSQSNSHSMHSEGMRFLNLKGISTKGLGMSSGLSGGNSGTVTPSKDLSPSAIKSIEEYSRVVQLFEFNRRGFLDKGVEGFIKNFSQLSQTQLTAWIGSEPKLSSILKKVNGELETLKNYNPNFIADPRKDPLAKKAFQISETTLSNSTEGVVSTIAYHALNGNVGPSTILLGGYDYHDGTQTTGDQADLKAGKFLGMILEYASLLQKKVMIQIITDGAVYSDIGTRVWRGDAGDKSMSVLVFFDPKNPVILQKTQIGAFTDGQSVDTDYWVSKNISGVGRVSFLNYLAFAGELNSASQLYKENELPPGELKDWISLAT